MLFDTENGPVEIGVEHLYIAGWTGRNKAAVQHHIEELAAIGVSPPSTVPLFYRVANTLLTTAKTVEVLGEISSGEAEPMLIRQGDKIWLGLGSDHTDRELEATSVAASKQACQKPCATSLWDLSTVSDHLDDIIIRAWVWEDDDWVLYQDGTLSQILPLLKLMNASEMPQESAMLCGTFPAINGVRSNNWFQAVMIDPVLNKEIQFEYGTINLTVIN
jgi:hypothetical protein